MDLNVFTFIFVSYLCIFSVFSQSITTNPSCIQKLMPCEPYLKPPASPPAICCAPLKQMIEDDVSCLCSIFGNTELLSRFNVTQDDALRLPQICGAHANVSLCKNGTTAPGISPATPTASNSSSPSESHKKNAANMVTNSDGLSYYTLFLGSLILAAF